MIQYLNIKHILLLAVIGLFGSSKIAAQEVALKTNLLYDATTTPNLGLEVSLGKRSSMQVFYGLNPWSFNSDTKGEQKVKHWSVMPEYRWWTCSVMNGFFVGVHAMGGQFNAGNVNLPIPGTFFSGDNLQQMVKDSRVEGSFVGGGVTAGYQWILSRHWNLEAEVGVGYNHVRYDQYPCSECAKKLKDGSTNYVGMTKLGLSLMYVF